MCDLAATQGITSGYFDGPRAWAIVKHKLTHGSTRTEEDKDFYWAAEHTQSENPPSTCNLTVATATEYAKKALAFLAHIRPNLAQAYSDDDTMCPRLTQPVVVCGCHTLIHWCRYSYAMESALNAL